MDVSISGYTILNDESISKLFSIVRFQHIVPIVATEEEALKVLLDEIK